MVESDGTRPPALALANYGSLLRKPAVVRLIGAVLAALIVFEPHEAVT
jgi:hypothetical protein